METLEELKAIIDNAPTDATHACIENGTHYQFKVVGLNAEIYTGDGWLCYSGCALPDLCGVRLISDIERIIELMETNREAKKFALLSLKEAIEPDGLINSEAGLKTIKTIQNAIDNIVRRL